MSLAPCPDCGKTLSYIDEYNKWFCYNCNAYKEPMPIGPPPKDKNLNPPDKELHRKTTENLAKQQIVSEERKVTISEDTPHVDVHPIIQPHKLEMPQIPVNKEKDVGFIKFLRILLILVGIVLIVSFIIYTILINANHNSFDHAQIIMLIMGIVILVMGIILIINSKKIDRSKTEVEEPPVIMSPLPPGEYPYSYQNQSKK